MRASLDAWALPLLALALAGCDGTPSPHDAGPHDAGPHDAGPPDTTRDARPTDLDAADLDLDAADLDLDAALDAGPAPTGCAAHDFLFCEDWESADDGALPTGWSVGGGWVDGAPAVTTSVAHAGTHALRGALATNGQHRAEHALDLGDARGRHWGRVFYRVAAPAFVPTSGVVHSTLVGLVGANEARVVDTVMSTSGAHQFLLNIPDDSCCVGSGFDYRSFDGAWHCAEWSVDDTTDSYRFFFDGEEVSAIAYTSEDGVPFEPFERIAVGLRNYQTAGTPYEAYFDDLALDDARIGCDAF